MLYTVQFFSWHLFVMEKKGRRTLIKYFQIAIQIFVFSTTKYLKTLKDTINK